MRKMNGNKRFLVIGSEQEESEEINGARGIVKKERRKLTVLVESTRSWTERPGKEKIGCFRGGFVDFLILFLAILFRGVKDGQNRMRK